MTLEELEDQKLSEISADYESRGYRVSLRPAPDDLPEFLKPFHPPLVATSADDNVVVEVRAWPRMEPDWLTHLAEAVESESGWRLELSTVSHPVAPDVPSQEDLATDEQVNRLLASAEELSSNGQIEAAVMLAWSALETLLRRTARSAVPELERQSSARVLKVLYSLGHIDPHTFEKLLELMNFRNAIAHGFQPRTAAPSLPDIMADIRRLQNAA